MLKVCPMEGTQAAPRIIGEASDANNLCGLADDLKALADATRLQIIHLLMSRGEMCVCEFTGLLDVIQSNVSFHLKTLKHAGFITARKEGKWIFYSLNRKALEQFHAEFGEVFDLEKLQENARHTASCDIPACKQMDFGSEEKQ